MSDDNPWTDDRARQSSLLEDDEALRTRDRSGETVTGSESFVDDRSGGADRGEQAGLFTEREELEDQSTLGGGTATRTTEGVLEPEIDAERGAAEPAVDERRGVPEMTNATLGAIATDAERESDTFDAQTGAVDPTPDEGAILERDQLPEELPGGFELAELRNDRNAGIREADYRAPSDVPGIDESTVRVQHTSGVDYLAVYETVEGAGPDAPDHVTSAKPRGSFEELDDALDRAESIAERQASNRAPSREDNTETIDLPGSGAEAGILAARFAERNADDLDGEILKEVRKELAEVREDGGPLELDREQLEELSDAVAEFGADASPAQRPEGFDVLEETVFGAEEPDRDPALAPSTSTTRETVEIAFGSRNAANEARQSIPEEARTGSYDGRHKTVEVRAEQLSEQQLNRLSGMAADSKAYEQEKVGQAPLSDRERREIDFTETTVPEARSAKAIFLDRGVDDWLSFFDPRLAVDEQRDLAEQAAQDDRGKRMDSEESAVEKEARARRRTAAELERFARQGAEAGEEEAVRTLVDELGWNERDARALAQSADDPQTRGKVLDTVVARALANGRFLREPPVRAPGAPSKYRSQKTGRFVGDRIDPSPGIGRDPADGRFLNKRRY